MLMKNIIVICFYHFTFFNPFNAHSFFFVTRPTDQVVVTNTICQRSNNFLLSLSHNNNNNNDELVLRHDNENNKEETKLLVLKSLLLWISYDGGRFTGWSASNNNKNSSSSRGFVRSIQFELQKRLAKVYGDIDPSQIIVDGTSRTDKGVHAQMMVAQIYGLKTTTTRKTSNDTTTNNTTYCYGKRLPHPTDAYDEDFCFLPLPMEPKQLLYVLNRMLPRDISIRGYQLPPKKKTTSVDQKKLLQLYPFHPSHNATSKTYNYTISVGPIHDPTKWRKTWHNYCNKKIWNSTRMEEACTYLEGKVYDYKFFRGAPRGKTDIRRFASQNTNCILTKVFIEDITTTDCLPGLTTYCISITGDRFLYKMVRFLVGTLVAIGKEDVTMDEFHTMLQDTTTTTTNKHHPKKPECAPANGLSLVRIAFGGHPSLQQSWKTG